jgi:dsRNA-specific ribonuclease
MREAILSNNTFSYLAISYHLVPSTPGAVPGQKIAADIFEAYIGACYRQARKEGKKAEMEDWLKRLFDPAVWPDLGNLAEWHHKHIMTTSLRKNKKAKAGEIAVPPRKARMLNRKAKKAALIVGRAMQSGEVLISAKKKSKYVLSLTS